MHLKENDLTHSINPRYIVRGRDYFTQGRVSSVTWYADQRTVAANVAGSRGRVYRLMIRLDRQHGALQIIGQCSCPMSYNCKHVVAVLFALIARQQSAGQVHGETLPRQLDLWFERLQAAEQQLHAPEPAERLLYLLDTSSNFAGRFVTVAVMKTRPLKNGGYAKPTTYRINPASSARFLRPEDLRLLALLEAGKRFVSHTLELRGSHGSLILEMLLDSGRCHWQSHTTPALSAAPALDSALQWVMHKDGSQHIQASAATTDSVLLPLSPPWLLDIPNARCAPLHTELAPALAETLAAAPPVPLEMAEKLAMTMQNSFPKQALPRPIIPAATQRQDIPPLCCLRMFSAQRPHYYRHDEQGWEHFAEFHFDYNGLVVHPWDERETLTQIDEAGVVLIERQGEVEQHVLNHLISLNFTPEEMGASDNPLLLYQPLGEPAWMRFVLEDLPALKRDGWRI